MKGVAQYLLRYAVPEARAFSDLLSSERERSEFGTWKNVLVIPSYNESPAFLKNLRQYSNVLLILVLNRPDTELNFSCNDELRDSVHKLKELSYHPDIGSTLRCVDANRRNSVLLIERPVPLPHKEGVGLARKIGCDVALALGNAGLVASPWIHCSDADATLPEEYFSAADSSDTAAAVTYPFRHLTPDDSQQRRAIELYENYLDHYVEGLSCAGSPYDFHTIGSCIAVKADAYAAVRGFPRRAAGEDFYLLNKVAKQGDIRTPAIAPILLSARVSNRAPFGTGPAIKQLLDAHAIESVPFFYDPRCFDGLAALLSYVKEYGAPRISISEFKVGLQGHPELFVAIKELGLEKFLAHAEKQCADKDAFILQFHQWLDGFRTLKLIHALSDYWPKLTAAESEQIRTRH
ncbi:hypothetical protein R0137_01325 [Congregibacter brevis]|uniref:Uncharacterized protein n=1 Tax=Congregibacter brevis TaxID=3081201 RepID=A0ABZ0IFX4_9GAMM|nr:hypothetical protein R0137_01325 [Congregibacter sp. IMCC45268]